MVDAFIAGVCEFCQKAPSGYWCVDCCRWTVSSPVAVKLDSMGDAGSPPSKRGKFQSPPSGHRPERGAPLIHAGQMSNFLRDSQSEEAQLLWNAEGKIMEDARAGRVTAQQVAELIHLRFATFAKLGEAEAINRFNSLCSLPSLASESSAWMKAHASTINAKDLRQVTYVNDSCKRLKFKDWCRAVDLMVASAVMKCTPPPIQSEEDVKLSKALQDADAATAARLQMEREISLLRMQLAESERREKDASELASLHRSQVQAHRVHSAKKARCSATNEDEEPLKQVTKFKVAEYRCVRRRANGTTCGHKQYVLGGPQGSDSNCPGGPSQCAQCYLECTLRGEQQPSFEFEQSFKLMSLERFEWVKARSLQQVAPPPNSGTSGAAKPTAAKSPPPSPPVKAPPPHPQQSVPDPQPWPCWSEVKAGLDAKERKERAEGARQKAQLAIAAEAMPPSEAPSKRPPLPSIPEASDSDEYEEPPLLADGSSST